MGRNYGKYLHECCLTVGEHKFWNEVDIPLFAMSHSFRRSPNLEVLIELFDTTNMDGKKKLYDFFYLQYWVNL